MILFLDLQKRDHLTLTFSISIEYTRASSDRECFSLYSCSKQISLTLNKRESFKTEQFVSLCAVEAFYLVFYYT